MTPSLTAALALLGTWILLTLAVTGATARTQRRSDDVLDTVEQLARRERDESAPGVRSRSED
ncbi:hypothetical protein [Halopiger djelfimassiliensis]|uniref:hypothetical protein n=1 Tax=Halopiger djelfimassiliensis TaxID=1293047 RepID=UPI000677659F|nr:hypothetical protein [Halopiger djelfimassiliensis]